MDINRRTRNFSAEQVDDLLNLVKTHKEIRCKKTDRVTSDMKDAAWKKVTIAFNALYGSSGLRTEKTLKKKYYNLKRSQKMNEMARSLLPTRNYVSSTDSEEKLIGFIHVKQIREMQDTDCAQASETTMEMQDTDCAQATETSIADEEEFQICLGDETSNCDTEPRTMYNHTLNLGNNQKLDGGVKEKEQENGWSSTASIKTNWTQVDIERKIELMRAKYKLERSLMQEKHQMEMDILKSVMEKNRLETKLMNEKHKLEMELLKVQIRNNSKQ